MTSPEELVAAAAPPDLLALDEVGADAAAVVRATYVRIWTPLSSGGRIDWGDEQWADELARPGVRAWLARVRGEPAGLAELEAEPSGDVGIVVFGLVPELVGRGFGGPFLTRVTRLAWSMRDETGAPPRRVWLQTSSLDHPHALRNYERRGFRIFRVEPRRGA